jgi:hypothetical protein
VELNIKSLKKSGIDNSQLQTTLGTKHKAKTNIKKAQQKRHHRKIKR